MDYALARRNMVESQLKPNKIIDERVIDAMSTVPRELFVPPRFRGVAYVDEWATSDGANRVGPLAASSTNYGC